MDGVEREFTVIEVDRVLAPFKGASVDREVWVSKDWFLYFLTVKSIRAHSNSLSTARLKSCTLIQHKNRIYHKILIVSVNKFCFYVELRVSYFNNWRWGIICRRSYIITTPWLLDRLHIIPHLYISLRILSFYFLLLKVLYFTVTYLYSILYLLIIS